MKLTPKLAARHAGVSPSLIYAWCAAGLPHFRLGRPGRRGRILIEEAELDAYLAERRVEAMPAPPVPLRHIKTA